MKRMRLLKLLEIYQKILVILLCIYVIEHPAYNLVDHYILGASVLIPIIIFIKGLTLF